MTAPSRILVVDDDPGMRRAMERILAPPYDVESADGAAEALARLATTAASTSRWSTCASATATATASARRCARRRPETDVILITGSISEPDEKLFRSLEEGAFYFLFKPFDRRVLTALVERCLRLQRERAPRRRYARPSPTTWRRRAGSSTACCRRAGRGGAAGASRGASAPATPWAATSASPQARDGSLVVAVTDVVGHGVERGDVRRHAALDARRGPPRGAPIPAPVARELLAGVDFFAAPPAPRCSTACSRRTAASRYFNAGHPPACSGPRTAECASSRRPGPCSTARCGTRPLAAAGGGSARATGCWPTDGLPEALDPADQELGPERLEAAFEAARPLPVGEALDALLALLRAHCAGRPLADDVTLLLVERVGD